LSAVARGVHGCLWHNMPGASSSTTHSGRRSGERRPPFARHRIPSDAPSEPRVKPSEGRRERAVATGSGFRTASGASPRPAGARGPQRGRTHPIAHSESRVKPSEGRRERAVTTGGACRSASGAGRSPAGARGPQRGRIHPMAHSEPRVKPSEGRRERAVATGSGFRTASRAGRRPAGACGPQRSQLSHSEGDSLN